jgi:hypothetical protein
LLVRASLATGAQPREVANALTPRKRAVAG